MGLSYRFFASLCSVSDSECGLSYLVFDLQFSVSRILYYSFFFEFFLVIYAGCYCTQSRIRPCICRLLYKKITYGMHFSCIHSRIYPIGAYNLGRVCLSLSSLVFFLLGIFLLVACLCESKVLCSTPFACLQAFDISLFEFSFIL